MDLFSGLLGGVAGGADAVSTLSAERRKQLAEQLRMETMEAMNIKRQDREFSFREGMAASSDQQAERMAGMKHDQLLERDEKGYALGQSERDRQYALKQKELALREGLLGNRAGGDGAGGAAPTLAPKDAHARMNDIFKTLVKEKWKEGEKLPEWAFTQINAIRRDAGMPPLTETESKSSTWWGKEKVSYNYGEGGEPQGGSPDSKPKPSGFDWRQFDPPQSDSPSAEAGPTIGNTQSQGVLPQSAGIPTSGVAPTPKAPEKVDPIGELSEGRQFGRSGQGGYVIIEDGKQRQPTKEEMKEIQEYVVKKPRMGGIAIPMPEYVGTPGAYKVGGRSTAAPANVSGRR